MDDLFTQTQNGISSPNKDITIYTPATSPFTKSGRYTPIISDQCNTKITIPLKHMASLKRKLFPPESFKYTVYPEGELKPTLSPAKKIVSEYIIPSFVFI
jgi:hypothetical protein